MGVEAPADGEVMVGMKVQPGEEIFLGMHGFNPVSSDVRFTRVEIVGLPPTVELLGTWAVSVEEAGRIVVTGPLASAPPLRPLRDLRLSAHEPELWYLVFGLRVGAPFKTTALRVHWRAGPDSGVETFPYRLAAEALLEKQR